MELHVDIQLNILDRNFGSALFVLMELVRLVNLNKQ